MDQLVSSSYLPSTGLSDTLPRPSPLVLVYLRALGGNDVVGGGQTLAQLLAITDDFHASTGSGARGG